MRVTPIVHARHQQTCCHAIVQSFFNQIDRLADRSLRSQSAKQSAEERYKNLSGGRQTSGARAHAIA